MALAHFVATQKKKKKISHVRSGSTRHVLNEAEKDKTRHPPTEKAEVDYVYHHHHT